MLSGRERERSADERWRTCFPVTVLVVTVSHLRVTHVLRCSCSRFVVVRKEGREEGRQKAGRERETGFLPLPPPLSLSLPRLEQQQLTRGERRVFRLHKRWGECVRRLEQLSLSLAACPVSAGAAGRRERERQEKEEEGEKRERENKYPVGRLVGRRRTPTDPAFLAAAAQPPPLDSGCEGEREREVR